MFSHLTVEYSVTQYTEVLYNAVLELLRFRWRIVRPDGGPSVQCRTSRLRLLVAAASPLFQVPRPTWMSCSAQCLQAMAQR
jgi:hypothetical protein